MRVDDFDFELPEKLIAQQPLADRAASRMLVLDRTAQTWQDRCFSDLPQYIQPADCLILNNTQVIPSRLFARRSSGAQIEVFLTREIGSAVWQALVRPGRKVLVGDTLVFSDRLSAEVTGRGDFGERTVRFTCDGNLDEELESIGHIPLPPYIRRPDSTEDRSRYQTVFARHKGSVAAPTAGLHFTPALLEDCVQAGAALAYVTLHVGLGTFAPLRADVLEDVRLHSERVQVSQETWNLIEQARRRIAVGTTSVRAVESGPGKAETNLFISPGYRFRFVDALLTNFHLPKSSLLMLVSALAGREFTLAAYAYAVREEYRFFSYGDCMLIL